MTSRIHTWVALGVMAVFALAAQAQPTSPSALAVSEAQVEIKAIRKALVDEALDGPTRVRAWAWVDGNGALHERNEVTSDMRVRGVRVREYVDKQQAPKLSIQAKQAVSATGQCRYAQGHWRLPMSVEVDISQVRLAGLRAVAVASIKEAEQAWSNTLRLGKRYETSARRVASMSPYQRALLGAVDSEASWRAKWSVQASEVAKAPNRYLSYFQGSSGGQSVVPNMADLVLRLDVVRERRDGNHATREQIWSRTMPVRVELVTAGWSSPKLSAMSQAQVVAIAETWGQELERQFACEPLQYEVTEIKSTTMRLNGGTSAGLQVGDRVVVMDASTVPTQVWDTGSLEKVAIARVQQVDAYGAYAKTIEGQLPTADGRLVALPY